MAKKKFLTKNEFRMDNNPAHQGAKKEPHPAYISGRIGHKYLANGITHSRRTTDGIENHRIYENPDKSVDTKLDKRKVRVTEPYLQSDKLFDNKKLENFRFSKKTRTRIKKINKKAQKNSTRATLPSFNCQHKAGSVEFHNKVTKNKSSVKTKKRGGKK